jgi:hypothetical protein
VSPRHAQEGGGIHRNGSIVGSPGPWRWWKAACLLKPLPNKARSRRAAGRAAHARHWASNPKDNRQRKETIHHEAVRPDAGSRAPVHLMRFGVEWSEASPSCGCLTCASRPRRCADEEVSVRINRWQPRRKKPCAADIWFIRLPNEVVAL